MCGIAGVVRPDPRSDDRSAVEAMTAALAHRGPDGTGTWAVPGVCLGHRRLAVIDLAGGAQPMVDAGRGLAVVSNSEFYNFRTLRQALIREGRRFRTRSDTEVLLHGYAVHGDAVLDRLDGLFALAVWDGAAPGGGRLLLARDRMGQKPLYWAPLADGGLAFASELTALLELPELERRIDPGALRRYLLHEYVPSPRTAIAGVYKLEPAHRLVWQPGQAPRVARWWDAWPVAGTPPPAAPDEDEAAEQLRSLLKQAVSARLVSDVPLGVFLSGGLDSSALVATLSGLIDPRTVETFSIGFDEPSFDEAEHARVVASHFRTRHRARVLRAGDVLDALPQVARLMDEPLADASIVPTHLLARFARERVTVALGGDGGDELLLGYPTFVAEGVAEAYRAVPSPLRSVAAAALRTVPVSAANFSAGFVARAFVRGAGLDRIQRHQTWLGSFDAGGLAGVLSPGLRPEDVGDDPLADLVAWQRRRRHADPWAELSDFYARYYLGDDVLTKVDRASMAVALEVRAPFLDPALVRWAATLPADLKLRGRSTKWLLRRAFRGVLPETILARPKKGFGIPLAAWLRGPLAGLADRLLDPARLAREGLFDPEAVRMLLEAHRSGRDDHRKPIWTLMTWQLWQERVGATL